jgi:TPR repeat protein
MAVDIDLNTYLDEIFSLSDKEADNDHRAAHVVELLQPYLRLRPNHGRAWFIYGECLRIVGRSQEAMDALLKALEFAPEQIKSNIFGRIGFLCRQHISPMTAEKWFKQATENTQKTIGWAWILRGANLAIMGEYEKALDCYQEALNLEDIDRDEVFLNMGLVLRAMKRYNEARLAFQEALKLNPTYQEAQWNLEGLLDIEETLQKTAKMPSIVQYTQWFHKIAERGDAEAQFKLGLMYQEGQVVPKSDVEAMKWYMRAAEQGHVDAQYNLGVMYDKGEAIPQNYTEAVKLYKKAAEQGHVNAQFNLGLMYHRGQGVTQNYAEAMKWHSKAAKLGDADAQLSVGCMYNKGEGVEQNSVEAKKWFRRSAEQGNVEAQEILKRLEQG